MKNAVTLLFTKEKSTKNTVKFTEVPAEDKPPMVGSLYVQQWAAGETTNLKVTIEPAA